MHYVSLCIVYGRRILMATEKHRVQRLTCSQSPVNVGIRCSRDTTTDRVQGVTTQSLGKAMFVAYKVSQIGRGDKQRAAEGDTEGETNIHYKRNARQTLL